MVSIVVPVYNVEKYLKECAESLINQTYKDVEIIFVDDGSTDNCPQIVDEYAEKYERVQVLHKLNGGLSSARNCGVLKARGEYIMFVDSDDYLDLSAVTTLMTAAETTGADVIEAGLTANKDLLAFGSGGVELIGKEELLKQFFSEKGLTVTACGQLYRRSLFKDTVFPEGRIFEDYATTFKLVQAAEKIATVDKNLYYYRDNPSSITTVKFSEKRMEYFIAGDEVAAFCKDNYRKLSRYVKNRNCRYAIAFFGQICKARYKNKAVFNELVKRVRKRIIPYLFSRYKPLSKIFGILVSVCPHLLFLLYK